MSLESCELTGGCLCGAVRFSGRALRAKVVLCHCGQCRRWSGHGWASVPVAGLAVADKRDLRWFRSSDHAERGFCAACGSSLFWRQDGRESVAVAAGALDAPTGLHLATHIFVADKGDYYGLGDGLPQFAQGSGG